MAKFEKTSFFAWLFIGAFFVFSALSKSLDFFAVSAKIQDYVRLVNVAVPVIICEVGSMILISTELIIGLLMIRGILRQQVYICMICLLSFFLLLTLYIALSGKFEDCGCFGSVWSATPWMSFIKNVILLLIATIAYPQSLQASSFKYPGLIICICLSLSLCVVSAFNQPLVDSSKFSIGDKLSINTESQASIDVDFIPDTLVKISRFGIVRKIDGQSTSKIIHSLEKNHTQPVIITSLIPKSINEEIYNDAIVGFIDNTTLSNLISSEFGIITLDDNATIIDKWQKSNINPMPYNTHYSNSCSLSRIAYMIIWGSILVYSIYWVFLTIMRGCRKTHQRVGTNSFI